MDLKINYIVIKNFRKHLDYQCDFIYGINEFMGLNGVGKTTVLDAITWCLFGKNFNDEKKFNIFPIINGKENKDLMPFVELEIQNGDKKYTIQRECYKSKSMVSASTILRINGAKFSNRDFDSYLKETIGIELEEFKILSKTNYAINFKESDLRALVYDVFNVKDKDILEHEKNAGKFDNIKEKIEDIGLEKTKDFLDNEKKILKQEYNKNKILLTDLETKLKIGKESIDEEQVRKDIERKKEISEIVSSNEEKIKEEKKKQDEIENTKLEIKKVENEIYNLKNIQKMKKENLDDVNAQILIGMNVDSLKESKIKEVSVNINYLENSKKELYLKMNNLKNSIESMKKDFEDFKNKEIQIEDDKCPFCNQKLPEDIIENSIKSKEEAKKKELNKKAKDINEKISLYNELKENYLKNEKEEKEIKDKIESIKNMPNEEFSEEFLKENKLLYSLKEQKEKLSKELVEIRNNGNELLEKHKLLKEKISKLPIPIKVTSKENLLLEIENINNRLSEFKKYKENYEEYKVIKSNFLDNEQELNSLENKVNEYNKYLKYKDLLIAKNIKKYFKDIDFKTTYLTNDGKENKCFVITVDGKDYKDLSTGEKLKASINFIIGLQKIRSKKFPILIDNFESVSRVDIEDSQIICCSAVKEPPKQISKKNENGDIEKVENENYDKIVEIYKNLQLKKYGG